MQEAPLTALALITRPPVPGRTGAVDPQEGVTAPVALPVLEPEVELELEVLLPVPTIPVELELELLPDVVPTIPVELELLPDVVPTTPVELELLPEDELEELDDELDELEELLELVLVELWPALPCPEEPPANIAIASSEGSVTPSTRPGTSIGVPASASTNSFPLA